MKILGIETSCDETGVAIVEDGHKILSNALAGSVDLTTAYGGVVPEIAARSHIEIILPVLEKALKDAKADWKEIDAIAVTQGPGLLGSLLIGVLTARSLAITKYKALYAVNHVEAHVYAVFLSDDQPKFPVLALIVSGGHSQLVLFRDHFDYKLLGQTADDAAGEAFDKVARMLGLPYPGGPALDKLAAKGDPNSVDLPKAKMPSPYDFSFSGLKTAVLRAAQEQIGESYNFPSFELPARLNESQKTNLAASFQKTITQTLAEALSKAADQFNPKSIVVAGGVAANQELRKQIGQLIKQPVFYPDIRLCTDNAAMIASIGYFLRKKRRPEADPYSLEPLPDLSM